MAYVLGPPNTVLINNKILQIFHDNSSPKYPLNVVHIHWNVVLIEVLAFEGLPKLPVLGGDVPGGREPAVASADTEGE